MKRNQGKSRKHGKHMEQPEHALLGNWLYFNFYDGGLGILCLLQLSFLVFNIHRIMSTFLRSSQVSDMHSCGAYAFYQMLIFILNIQVCTNMTFYVFL
jgi:hypothetical protein